jgi:hypothetical protein
MITLAPAAVQSPALVAPPSLLATTVPSPTTDSSNTFPSLPTASHGLALFPALSPPTSQAPRHLPTTTAPATSLRACLLRCCPQTTPAHRASAPLATATRTSSRWSMRMLTLTVRFPKSGGGSSLSYAMLYKQKTNHTQCLDTGYRLSNPSMQPVSPHTYMAQQQQSAWNMYPVYYPQAQSSVH